MRQVISDEEQKEHQRLVYNKTLFNHPKTGLGLQGFDKIKTLKDFVNYGFIKNLKLKKGEKLLDLGCNAGELLNKIVATYRVEGYGLDISDKTIDVAKQYNPYGNHYIAADGENMPYQDNFFDVIVSTDVLEHVPHPEKVMSEIARTLKPGGRFFVYCISKRNFLSAGWFMQKFHYKKAWGDLADHQKELLVDPKIFATLPYLEVRKTTFFDSFFMHFLDEFVVRPFLALVAKKPSAHVTKSEDLALTRVSHPVTLSRSARIYLFFLGVLYYLALVLDSPWRLFKVSNAILVTGIKKG